MLIAVLQYGSCIQRDSAYGMVHRASMWVVGDSTQPELDGEHLLDLGLLVRNEAPDAGGRHPFWGYARRFLPTAAARARFVALAGAPDATA